MTTANSRSIDVSMFQISRQPSKAAKNIDIPENLQVIDDDEQPVGENQGSMRIFTPADGDKRVVWDTYSLQQINEAEQMFNQLKQEGLEPYRIDPNGNKEPEPMDDFDAAAGEILFLPVRAAVGG